MYNIRHNLCHTCGEALSLGNHNISPDFAGQYPTESCPNCGIDTLAVCISKDQTLFYVCNDCGSRWWSDDEAMSYFRLGQELDEEDRLEEAETAYREVIRLKPDFIQAHYKLGIVLGDMRRYEEAEREYREVLRLEPDNSSAWFNLVMVLQDRGLLSHEELKLRRWTERNPSDVLALDTFAHFLDAIGKNDEARIYWQKVLNLEKRPKWIRRIKRRLKWRY